ncbi:unnamed protein product [Laminaria digitata]
MVVFMQQHKLASMFSPVIRYRSSYPETMTATRRSTDVEPPRMDRTTLPDASLGGRFRCSCLIPVLMAYLVPGKLHPGTLKAAVRHFQRPPFLFYLWCILLVCRFR